MVSTCEIFIGVSVSKLFGIPVSFSCMIYAICHKLIDLFFRWQCFHNIHVLDLLINAEILINGKIVLLIELVEHIRYILEFSLEVFAVLENPLFNTCVIESLLQFSLDNNFAILENSKEGVIGES